MLTQKQANGQRGRLVLVTMLSTHRGLISKYAKLSGTDTSTSAVLIPATICLKDVIPLRIVDAGVRRRRAQGPDADPTLAGPPTWSGLDVP